MTVGAVGARTSPFKTIRIDETTLQRYGITVETFDLSYVFARMMSIKEKDKVYQEKARFFKNYSDFSQVPKGAFGKIVRLAVVLDSLIEEYCLDALGLRCWLEIEQQLGISPCVIMSALNEGMIPAACGVDVGIAGAMSALGFAFCVV